MTLHDEGVVELWDLSSNFIFSEDDVGKNRALASVQKLQELNNAVLISTITTELTKEQLSNFQVACHFLFIFVFFNLRFLSNFTTVPVASFMSLLFINLLY